MGIVRERIDGPARPAGVEQRPDLALPSIPIHAALVVPGLVGVRALGHPIVVHQANIRGEAISRPLEGHKGPDLAGLRVPVHGRGLADDVESGEALVEILAQGLASLRLIPAIAARRVHTIKGEAHLLDPGAELLGIEGIMVGVLPRPRLGPVGHEVIIAIAHPKLRLHPIRHPQIAKLIVEPRLGEVLGIVAIAWIMKVVAPVDAYIDRVTRRSFCLNPAPQLPHPLLLPAAQLEGGVALLVGPIGVGDGQGPVA